MMRKLFSILCFAFLLAGCEVLELTEPEPVVQYRVPKCADARLEISYRFHDRAKKYFSSFYKTRKESSLYYAWYAAEDSTYMAGSIRKCRDKRNKHYYAVRSLADKNSVLKKLIMQNMRLSSQSLSAQIFLEQYQEIFPRDIQ